MPQKQALRWWRKRSIFWLFLATYIVISAVSLPLTAYSYWRYDRVLQRKVGEETNAQLKQAAQHVNGMLAALRQAVTTVGMNTQNSSLLYASLPLPPDAVYQLTQYIGRMQEAFIANDALYDLYTYFPQLGSVVTCTTRYTAQDFHRIFLQYRDMDQAQWQAEMDEYAYLRYRAARTIGVPRYARDVITLTLSVSALGSQTVRANIVGAMDVHTLVQAFVPTNFLREGQVVLYAGDQVLCSLGQPLFSATELIADAPYRAGEAVWATYGDRPLLLLSAGADAPEGVRYLCVLPQSAYTGELGAARRLVIAILFTELTLGIGLSVAFAWLNVTPIRKAAERLPALGGERFPRRNELERIETASLALLHENQRIKQTLQEQRQMMRSSLIRQLLLGTVTGGNAAWENHDLQFPHRNFAVLQLHIEESGDFNAEESIEQQVLLVYSLLNLLVDHFETKYACYGTDMSAEHIALLINLPEGTQAEALWPMCSDFCDASFADLGVLCSAGISAVHTGAACIVHAYRESVAALDHIRLWQVGNIALYSQLRHETPSYAYTQETENAVMHSVRLCHLESIRGWIHAVLDLSGRQPIAYVRGLCYDIVGTGMKLLGEMGVAPEQIFSREDAPMQRIDRCHTLPEIKSALTDILTTIALRLAHDRSSRNQALCQQVDQMIEAHFADSALSLSMVAERLGMNASYLSHSYKKQSGENFIDALGNRRIAHARKLLRESRAPIAQIAVQCGYISAAYFTRAFKRLEGCTPGQYRNG